MATRESSSFRNLTLDELASIREEALLFASAEGLDAKTNRHYRFDFIPEHPNGPYIRIHTSPRKIFLEQGTEQEAQDALVDLSTRVKAKTGGYFDIHPFYGSVWGTKLTTVAPEFCTNVEAPDEDLMMLIFLTDIGRNFDKGLTQEFQRIGLSFAVSSPNAQSYLRYMENLKGQNPNQKNRDQAIANGLQIPWEAQFKKFNEGRSPRAMHMSPPSIAGLMKSLQSEGIQNVQASRVNFR